ncbi:MAG: SMP-30/gluconolactonase/LRE family protein [Bacteroidetes bacterium]|nr:SMP-30/gluconolactonase/LRE family protein [Bacteroidota bacterium]
MNKIKLLCMLSSLFVIAPLTAQENGMDAILKKGAVVEKLADGFEFTEGPTVDKKGNVYFTDQPNNRILIWSFKTGLSVFMEPAGRANGLCLDNEGFLWVCADEKNELWRISPDKKVEIIAAKYNGKSFNGPNDVWVMPNGGVYFSDPFYVRNYWDHKDMPQDKECLYYLHPDHKTVVRVIEDMKGPNGIIATPDGKKLFVADIKGNKTWSYTAHPDGSLTDKTLFCEMGSDGITIDSKGNLYLTGRGVTVFDKTGKKIGNIEMPPGWTSNVCFGDKNRKTLFITSGKAVYKIKTKMKGTY